MVETSNTVLVVKKEERKKDDAHEAETLYRIDGSVSCHFELEEIVPKTYRIGELLRENLLSSSVGCMDEESPSKLYSWDDLVNIVQASDLQLRKGLKEFKAFEFEGHFRVLADAYMDEVMDMILAVMEAKNMDFTNASIPLIAKEFPEYNEKIIYHCVSCHSTSVDDSGFAELDPALISAFRAHSIFHMNPIIAKNDFLNKWIPLLGSILPDQKILRGICVCLVVNNTEVLRYMPSLSLPPVPHARFKFLFDVKPKWRFEEIQPYVLDLLAPAQTTEQLILKYSRVNKITIDSQIIVEYSAK